MTRHSSNNSSMVFGTQDSVAADAAVADNDAAGSSSSSEMRNIPQSFKRFRILAQKIANQQQTPAPVRIDESIQRQLNHYVNELRQNLFGHSSGGNCLN